MNYSKLLFLIIFLLGGVATHAQQNHEESIGDKTEHRPHFFIQAQGGAAYTLGENTFGKLISPAAAINVGYKFIPEFGLRIGASGWQAKGSWVAPRMDYKYKYIAANLDAIVSLTNIFCGFNPQRTLDFYAFVGVGYNHAFDNDEAIAVNHITQGMEYLWTDSKDLIAGRGGLGLNIRLSNIVAINIEANANGMSDHFNSKKAGNADWQFNALAGLTINLGKNHRVIPAPFVEEYVEPIPEPQPQPEPTPVPEPQPQPTEEEPAVEISEPMQCNIFFLINSAKIRATEQSKVEEMAEYLHSNPSATVTITGYADRQTGSASYNMDISRRRAESVATALTTAGISNDRITVKAKGCEEQPFAEQTENRVAICISE